MAGLIVMQYFKYQWIEWTNKCNLLYIYDDDDDVYIKSILVVSI